MSSPIRTRNRVLLSTISSDSHTWNLVFLQLLLEERGYEVVNLGPCVPDESLIDAVRRHRPDAVVISSVNGHGHLDGERMIRKLRADTEVGDVQVMIGGKLGIQGDGNAALAEGLVQAGFDAVFTDTAPLDSLFGALGQIPAGSPPACPASEGPAA